MVGVIVLAVRNDERRRMIEREGAVRLVRLDDQNGTRRNGLVTDARDGERAGFAADGPGDVFAERAEELRDEGGGRRLAVGAADGNGFARADDFRKHFTSVAEVPCGDEFRVVVVDGRRDDDLVHLLDVRGIVPERHGDAH